MNKKINLNFFIFLLVKSMIIPQDLKFLNAVEASTAIVDRKNQTIFLLGDSTVQSNSTTQTGQILEFSIPVVQNSSWDMSTFFVHFTIRINIAGLGKTYQTDPSLINFHTRIHFHDSIESIFKSIRVFIGSSNQQLEFIDQYNSLETALNIHGVCQNYVRSYGSATMGCGLASHTRNQLYHNQEAAAVLTANNGERDNNFSVPLRLLGISSPSVILPSQSFGSGSFLRIQIELEAPYNCIVASQELTAYDQATGIISSAPNGDNALLTNPQLLKYTLSNIRATCDQVTFSNEYSALVNNALASSKIVVPIQSYDVQVRTISGTQQKYVENLAFSYSSINAVYVFFQKQSEVNNPLIAGKDRLWYPTWDNEATWLKDIQLKVNGINVPNGRPINCEFGGSEAYVHTIEALNLLHSYEQVGSMSYQPDLIKISGNALSGTPTMSSYLANSIFTGDIYYGRNRYAGNQVDCTQSLNLFTNNFTTLNVAHTATNSYINPYIREMSPSRFMVGFNLKKLLRSDEGVISGTNLMNTSGQISYEINLSARPTNAEAYLMYFVVVHDRFIEMSGIGSTVRT